MSVTININLMPEDVADDDPVDVDTTEDEEDDLADEDELDHP